jgi:hypothetical protein
MIHTEEDDEFSRIEHENAMKGQPYHWEAEAIKAAIRMEREACAKIAEYKLDNKGLIAPNSPKEWWNLACQNIRDAILARGNT